ncbi:MAG TPA: TraB/GumN family protein [Flavobacteriales bacterium]|nr:TraB/GumN family protein [Flavobacteriales bacterium]
MRRFYSAIAFFLSFFPSLLSAQETENALFWKIKDLNTKHVSYILGTYHLVNNEFLAQIAGCEKALKKTKAVMGEMEVTPEVAASMMPHMLLSEGSLEDLFTPEQYDSIQTTLMSKLGMPITLFSKMKPIGIYFLFSTSEMKNTDIVSDYKGVPMDLYVQNEAKKNKKPILALESIEEQSELLFNSTPVSRQAEMLMEYIRKGDQTGDTEDIARMNTCYKSQDLNCLDSLMKNSGYSSIESDLLLKNRNERWIAPIKKAISEQSCFIAVGALHLAGENGLVALLRKEGYTISPVRSEKDIQ